MLFNVNQNFQKFRFPIRFLTVRLNFFLNFTDFLPFPKYFGLFQCFENVSLKCNFELSNMTSVN